MLPMEHLANNSNGKINIGISIDDRHFVFRGNDAIPFCVYFSS